MMVEQQYIELFSQTEAMICKHSAEVLNAPRASAFADFERLGFPTRKMEKYKYTDVSKYFEPDFGLNLNRLAIPVNPYEVFKCDVPNMSTSLYFGELPEEQQSTTNCRCRIGYCFSRIYTGYSHKMWQY